MPVQHRADEQRLLHMGLSNYWGYTTIGWFAPEARYWSGRARHHPRQRIPRHGRRHPRARHGTGDRRGLQPQRRNRRARPHAVDARHRQRPLLPPAPRRPRPLRELDRLRQLPQPRRAARAATGDGQPAPLGLRDSASTASASTSRRCSGAMRRRRVRCARALLRRHRPGPGALARAAHRRALGHRPGRLPPRRIPARLARMERPLPRHAARLLAAAGHGDQACGDFAHRFTASSGQFRAQRPRAHRERQLRHRARRLHAARPA